MIIPSWITKLKYHVDICLLYQPDRTRFLAKKRKSNSDIYQNSDYIIIIFVCLLTYYPHTQEFSFSRFCFCGVPKTTDLLNPGWNSVFNICSYFFFLMFFYFSFRNKTLGNFILIFFGSLSVERKKERFSPT